MADPDDLLKPFRREVVEFGEEKAGCPRRAIPRQTAIGAPRVPNLVFGGAAGFYLVRPLLVAGGSANMDIIEVRFPKSVGVPARWSPGRRSAPE